MQTEEEKIFDTLNLRWNNKLAIFDANLIKNIFCPPNCIDATPGGMIFWREITIKGKQIQITLFDSESNNIVFEVKNIKNIQKSDAKFLGYNYCKTGENSCILRGDGFQDTVGLFILLTFLETNISMFKSTIVYNQIRNLPSEDLQKLLKVSIAPLPEKEQTPIKQDIPKIDQSTKTEETSYPQPLREVIKPEPTSLPTLVGSHPMSNIVNIFNPTNNIPGLYPSSNTCVRTPEGQPVHFNY